MVLYTLLGYENQRVEVEFDNHCKRELVTISHLGGCVFFCPEKYLCLQCPLFRMIMSLRVFTGEGEDFHSKSSC